MMEALAVVRQFNARLSAQGSIWAWPTVAAAITAQHPWLVIACDSCATVVDLDLRVKPCAPDASIRVFAARAATGMGARALRRWLGIRRFEDAADR